MESSSGWSSENIYAIVSGAAQTAYWISMASKPTIGANEIAVGVVGDVSRLDAYGLIWNGYAFSSQHLLTDSVSIATKECITVAYEQVSGYATFVSSTSNDAFSGNGQEAHGMFQLPHLTCLVQALQTGLH